jgi:putative transcriptional regulator
MFAPKHLKIVIHSNYPLGITGEMASRLKTQLHDEPKIGSLLVDSRRLTNTPFDRAVILIMQDDENGTLGMTLNRLAGERLVSAMEASIGITNAPRSSLVHGGPLASPILALHRSRDHAEFEIPGGLYLSSQKNNLRQLARQVAEPYRIVCGLAGWQAKQLRQELYHGFWYNVQVDADLIFSETQDLWPTCIRYYGGRIVSDITGIENLPSDPSVN